MTSTSPDGVTTFSIVISFFVSVPVLSEQTTDAEPSVSTDDSRFTIARWRGHALHAEGEHDRQDGRQPLRHGGDRQRHADEQHVDEVGGVLDVGGEQDRGHDDDGDRR